MASKEVPKRTSLTVSKISSKCLTCKVQQSAKKKHLLSLLVKLIFTLIDKIEVDLMMS